MSHDPTSSATVTLLPRVFVLGLACALALWPLSGKASASVVCKRTGADGVTEYKSTSHCGKGWTKAADYQPDTQSAPSVPMPTTPDQAAPMPMPATPSTATPDALPAPTTTQSSLQNFGDPNAAAALAKLHGGAGTSFRYLQIGDSHTAGDFLTERLRLRLQQQLGDGGIGWVTPMQIPGQRMARMTFMQSGWQLISSRSSGPGNDYPFGGFIAQVSASFASLTLTPRYQTGRQSITLLIKQGLLDAPLTVTDAGGIHLAIKSPTPDDQWHTVTFEAELPITLSATISPQTAIGGWWMRSVGNSGAIVSAAGINGSELEQWNRWRNGWMDDLGAANPDIIALAYGTNEAFRTTLDPEALRATLTTAINQLRQRFPNSAILIIGAPESLKSFAGGRCGTRATGLDAVQAVQRAVAQQQHTLYWDWQQAMGGACSMTGWVSRGLARRDGVHFSREGYEALADDLYAGLVR